MHLFIVLSTKIKRMTYPKEHVEEAIEAVKCGMSTNAASAKYKIPSSTLHSKIIGKYADKKPGPSSILPPAEEETLVKWILWCSERGYPITKHHLISSVKMIVDKTGILSEKVAQVEPGLRDF